MRFFEERGEKLTEVEAGSLRHRHLLLLFKAPTMWAHQIGKMPSVALLLVNFLNNVKCY